MYWVFIWEIAQCNTCQFWPDLWTDNICLLVCLINFTFSIFFYFKLSIIWCMETFANMGCFSRWFLKLLSNIMFFFRRIFESTSGIKHQFKLILFSFILTKMNSWGSVILKTFYQFMKVTFRTKIMLSHKLTFEVLTSQQSAYDWA